MSGKVRVSAVAANDSGFGPDHGATRSPAQEVRLDERIDHALTRGTVETEQPRGLFRGQPQARHLVELGSNTPQERREIHASVSASGWPTRSAEEGRDRDPSAENPGCSWVFHQHEIGRASCRERVYI